MTIGEPSFIRLRESDMSDLDRNVRESLPATLRFAVRLTGNLDSAEDLVQEALMRAARSWSNYRGEAAFQTWLFRIVINVFRDSQPRRQPAESLDDFETSDDAACGPQQAMLLTELDELVAQLVSALPPRQREVMVLCGFEGQTPAQAAALLGISEANVRSHLHLARKWLRKKLSPYLAER